MKALHCIAFVLVVIGSLNWLLVAFDWNLVDAIFGAGSTLAKLVYVLVGLSAIWLVISHKKDCKHCSASSSSAAPMA